MPSQWPAEKKEESFSAHLRESDEAEGDDENAHFLLIDEPLIEKKRKAVHLKENDYAFSSLISLFIY